MKLSGFKLPFILNNSTITDSLNKGIENTAAVINTYRAGCKTLMRGKAAFAPGISALNCEIDVQRTCGMLAK